MATRKRSKKTGDKSKRSRPRADGASVAPSVAPPPRGSGTRWLVIAAAAALVVGVLVWEGSPPGTVAPESLRLLVIERHPHDTGAFTQGLLWHEGKLYESTGQYGESTVRRVDLATGEVEEQTPLPDDLFAEGLARMGDELVQITWRGRKALVWDLGDLSSVREHSYHGEGWGLCFDGERFVMSTGSDRLVFRDPRTFERIGEVRVKRAGRPLRRLNELECVDGLVYANIWMDDNIARIDPETGDVTGWIDASGLLPEDERTGGEDVLNGIAYIPETGHFLLTGKNWPFLFEVDFVPTQ